jgi:cysteinyl-tRNA synthetase
MSKSLGNFFTVRDLLARYAGHPYHIPYFGPAIRLRFLQTGYRDPIDMTDVSIEQSAILLGRYYRTLEDDRSLSSAVVKEVLQRSEFIAAVSDDLNTPLAVKLLNDAAMHARIFTWPTEDGPVTYVTDAETDRDELLQKQIKAMLQFLGFELSHLRHFDYQSRSDDLKSVLNAEAAVLIEALLSDRAKARKQKDFTRADALRDGFAAAGVIVKDTPAGASWELSPEFDPAKLEALK